MYKKNNKHKIGSNRSFGIVFFVVFLIVALWSFRGDIGEIKTIPLVISVIFLILGLINSKILTPLNRLWMKFGYALGAVIAPVVMGVIFFVVITPIGLIMRLLGKDLLMRKYSNRTSYWIEREKDLGTMKKQF